MTTIVHMTTRSDWDQALDRGTYTCPSLATEGFIHCSLPDQVAGVANTLYSGRDDLILLWIDQARVALEVRYEGDPEHYPHIYGPLNLDAVLEVTPYRPDANGRFRAPTRP